MNWFTSGRNGTLLEGLNEIAHLSHDIYTEDKNVSDLLWRLWSGSEAIDIGNGYQHFRGTGCCHCQGGY
jgi:hypothetical protein